MSKGVESQSEAGHEAGDKFNPNRLQKVMLYVKRNKLGKIVNLSACSGAIRLCDNPLRYQKKISECIILIH